MSITTVQLLQRVARRARPASDSNGGDVTRFSLSEQGDMLQACNAALQQCYNALPVYFKDITVGMTLPAPLAVTLNVTAGSSTLNATAFTSDQVGRSVVIQGDPNWNQILGPTSLLNPYMGRTGLQPATVYGDAVYSTRYPFDRIIGNPRFPTPNLYPMLRTEMYYGSLVTPFVYTVGMPQSWWVQTFGNSQGINPMLALRFAPAPDQAYVIDVRMAFWPLRLLESDFEAATVIPVPDQFIETALIPLALRNLMLTPIFDKQDPQTIIAAATAAEEYLRLQPTQVGAPSNRVFTPIGF